MTKFKCHVRKKKCETGDRAPGGDNLVGCTKYVLTTNTNANQIQSPCWKEGVKPEMELRVATSLRVAKTQTHCGWNVCVDIGWW